MRPALRYAASGAVGSVVTGAVVVVTTTDALVTVSLFPLYAVVTSLVIAHRQEWLTRSRADSGGRRAGAAIGGAGAVAGGALLRTSVPAAAAGFGLLCLGMAGAVALVER
jgi:hypothetical protein